MTNERQNHPSGLGQSIMQGLQEAILYKKGKLDKQHKLDVRYYASPPKNVDVRQIRSGLGLTQQEFSSLSGYSVRTIQNWEQNTRSPKASDRIFLKLIEKHPENVWDIVKSNPS